MRDFQAVFGAFGGGKGQGGGSPEDFRSFFRRFYEFFWVSQPEAARLVLELRAAVAGAFGMPAVHGWLLHAGVAGTISYVYLCFKKIFVHVLIAS
jgi:hypothetical protein